MGIPMPPRAEKSWFTLAEGIGRYRAAVAHAAGRERDTVDAWCRPQPAPTPQDCDSTGRPNPLDYLASILENAEHPGVIREWLANLLDWYPLPRHLRLPGDLLPIQTASLRRVLDELLRELNRRSPTFSDDRLRDLRDQAIDGLHVLVERELERRRKPKRITPK